MKTNKREATLRRLNISVRLSDSLIERAKIRAIQERRKIQDVFGRALELYLKTPLDREEDSQRKSPPGD